MAFLKRLFHVTDGIVIPLIIVAAFSLLFLEGQPRGVAAISFAIATAVMIFLWNLMRELRLQAIATRAAAVGEPDELIALADAQLKRRYTQRSRAPFFVYLGLAREQRAEWDQAIEALDRAKATGALKPAWRMLAACARTGVLVERGDAAGARAIYDGEVATLAARLNGPGARLLAVEAEARVKFAEGDDAAAAPVFKRMSSDIRLGPATRALAHWYAARLAERGGDADAATRHFESAAKLAPKTFAATRPAPSSPG